MTDEEHQKLCAKLRQEYYDGELVASEIERLAKRLEELEQRDRDIANDIRALARWV